MPPARMYRKNEKKLQQNSRLRSQVPRFQRWASMPALPEQRLHWSSQRDVCGLSTLLRLLWGRLLRYLHDFRSWWWALYHSWLQAHFPCWVHQKARFWSLALPTYHLGLLELLSMQADNRHLIGPLGAAQWANVTAHNEEESLRDEFRACKIRGNRQKPSSLRP